MTTLRITLAMLIAALVLYGSVGVLLKYMSRKE